MNIVHVSRAELTKQFVQSGVWTALQQQAAYKCEARDKVSIPVKAGHAPAGGVQIIHKWSDFTGKHLVTTHSVLDADSWPGIGMRRTLLLATRSTYTIEG